MLKKNHLIIAGTHKSGTTSLFNHLSSHPQISPSKVKETHFYTPLRYGKQIGTYQDYLAYFHNIKPNTKFILEASPSYFYGNSALFGRIRNDLGNRLKCIVILRNPVDRLVSFYNHAQYAMYLPKDLSFEHFLTQSIKGSKGVEQDNPIARGVREGYYLNYLKEWDQEFKSETKILFFEHFIQQSECQLKEIANWLELDSALEIDKANKSNQSRGFNYRGLHKMALHLNRKAEPFFNRSPILKKKLRSIYGQLNDSGKKYKPNKEIQLTLEDLYRDSNQKLADYLLQQDNSINLPDWLKSK